MDCRAFRSLHGDWVDDVLGSRDADRLSVHLADCAPCARFDTLARRALLVARNAPPIECSADFSTRLAQRIAEERRHRIAEVKPSHAERSLRFGGGKVWARIAAALLVTVGGSLVARSGTTSVSAASLLQTGATGGEASRYEAGLVEGSANLGGMTSSMAKVPLGAPVTMPPMRPIRPEGGALLPLSDDPLLDGADLAGTGDATSTSLAATAPLWPAAQMAAHAAYRFAAMEFGDVQPVTFKGAIR